MTDGSTLAFLLDGLAPLGVLRSRHMFGGHGVYLGDAFFAIVHRGRIYFRTDEQSREEYRARGSQPFMPGPDQTLGTYWELPADVLEDPELLQRWARHAADRPPPRPRPADRSAARRRTRPGR